MQGRGSARTVGAMTSMLNLPLIMRLKRRPGVVTRHVVSYCREQARDMRYMRELNIETMDYSGLR